MERDREEGEVKYGPCLLVQLPLLRPYNHVQAESQHTQCNQSTEQHTYMNIPLRTEHIPLQGPVRLTIRSTPILLSRTHWACAERVQHPDPSSLHTYDAFGGEGIEVGGLDAASGVHEVHLIVAQVLCSGGAGCGAGGGTRATAAGVDRVSHGGESFLPSAST